MPVSVLLCEGNPNSPDVRLLRVVLRGIRLEITPIGGKDGLPRLIISWRSAKSDVCGLIDNDFPRKPLEWSVPDPNAACEWHTTVEEQRIMIGWRWRRKEIENYLLDPDILTKALRWSDTQRSSYEGGLQRVIDSLGVVTAARMAITACAPKRNRVETDVPLDADVAQMKVELEKVAEEHTRAASLEKADLLASFDSLLPDCSRGGRFHESALDIFSGKNLRSRLCNEPGIPPDLKNWKKLRETVLDALEKDPSSHTWLSEWTALRTAVEAF